MKTVFLLLLVNLSALSLFAQVNNNCAPQKETMDWIASKMKEHLQSPRIFVSYENGAFKYKVPIKLDDGTDGYSINTINLYKITSFRDGAYNFVYAIKGNSLLYKVKYNSRGGMISTYTDVEVIVSEQLGYTYPISFSEEANLGPRMVKACTCLVAYNTTSKNEAY